MLTGVRGTLCGATAIPGVADTGCTAAGCADIAGPCCAPALTPSNNEAVKNHPQRCISLPFFPRSFELTNYEASWNVTFTAPVKSTGAPFRCAGLYLILFAAA